MWFWIPKLRGLYFLTPLLLARLNLGLELEFPCELFNPKRQIVRDEWVQRPANQPGDTQLLNRLLRVYGRSGEGHGLMHMPESPHGFIPFCLRPGGENGKNPEWA